MLRRYAANIKPLPLAAIVSAISSRRAMSSRNNLSPKVVADMVIESIADRVNKKPQTLFAVLRSYSSADNTVPEGIFGPHGLYKISQLHDLLRSHDSFKESAPTSEMQRLEHEYQRLTDPTIARSPQSYVLEAFDAIVMEHSPNVVFKNLITAQIKKQCNTIPIITSLILSGSIDPEKIVNAKVECASNLRFDLAGYIKTVNHIGIFDRAIKEFQKLDPETDLKSFYYSYDKLSNAEFQLRVSMKQHADLEFDPENFPDIHSALGFFVRNIESIPSIDRALVAANKKDHKELKRALDETQADVLKEFMHHGTQTLSGRTLASIIVGNGHAKSMKVLVEAGYDPANWRQEDSILPEDHPLNQAITENNIEMTRVLLEAGAPIVEEFYTRQGLKSPFQRATELSKSSDGISQEILHMILLRDSGIKIPNTSINSATASPTKNDGNNKSPHKI